MLIVSDDNDPERKFKFFIVDFHSHLGIDIDGANSIISPSQPGSTFDYISWFTWGREGDDGVLPKLLADAELPPDERVCKYHPETRESVAFHPILESITRSSEAALKTIKHAKCIDVSIVFPMQDEFGTRAGRYDGPIDYVPSINNIERWVNRFPFSMKIIGFARLNPWDISTVKEFDDLDLGALERNDDPVIKELDTAVQVKGLQGLKLHPRSESFSANIPQVVALLIKSAMLDIPVIFDCRAIGVARKITEGTKHAVAFLWNQNRLDLIGRLRVVIAHFGWHVAYPELVEFLQFPNLYGDFSAARGAAAHGFISKTDPFRTSTTKGRLEALIAAMRERYSSNDEVPSALRLKNPEKFTLAALAPYYPIDLHTPHWYDKLVFGTDHPFIPYRLPVEVTIALLSRALDLTPLELTKLFGYNALRLIPPKFKILTSPTPSASTKPSRFSDWFTQLSSATRSPLRAFDYLISPEITPSVKNDVLVVVSGDESAKHVILTRLQDSLFASDIPDSVEKKLDDRVYYLDASIRDRVIGPILAGAL